MKQKYRESRYRPLVSGGPAPWEELRQVVSPAPQGLLNRDYGVIGQSLHEGSAVPAGPRDELMRRGMGRNRCKRLETVIN